MLEREEDGDTLIAREKLGSVQNRRNSNTGSKKTMAEKKSQLPLPRGKENSGPRIVKPVVHPHKNSYQANPSLESSHITSMENIPVTMSDIKTLPASQVKSTSSSYSRLISSKSRSSIPEYASSSSGISSARSDSPHQAGSGVSTLTSGTPTSLQTTQLGVQYTLSPATRTTFTSSYYAVSPSELASRLAQTAQGERNSSPESTPQASPLKSASSRNGLAYLTSKSVPQIHDIILSKIKHNKRKSSKSTPTRSPLKAPAPKKEEDQLFLGEGESSSSVGSISTSRPSSACSDTIDSLDEDLIEEYLGSLFKSVDEYRTGVVKSNKLLDQLLSFVDLPQLDQWKIDELRRLLDPNHDDRPVDEEQFILFGKKWVDMISGAGAIDAIVDNVPSTSEIGKYWKDQVETGGSLENSFRKEDLNNFSFGSVEGVGGLPGCNSREVELEAKCIELTHQLNRQQQDYLVLQRTLAVSEENSVDLAHRLEISQKRIDDLSGGLERASCSAEEAEAVAAAGKIAQEKCCDLSAKVEELKDVVSQRNKQIKEMEEMCNGYQKEVVSVTKKEKIAVQNVTLMEAEITRLAQELESKDIANEKLELIRKEKEGELEVAGRELSRVERELDARNEEIKNMTANLGTGVLGNNSISINGANILDVSVDDKVIEDLSGSNSPTPHKVFPCSPALTRGPSASSTPNRVRRGSIVDELKEVGIHTSFPSPLCGKEEKENKLANKLQSEVGRWQESVRRAIIEEADSALTGRLISGVNKAMDSIKKDVMGKVELAEEEMLSRNEELRKEVEELTMELDATRTELMRAKEELDRRDELLDQMEEQLNKKLEVDVQQKMKRKEMEAVETRVSEMANLLQVANKALLAVGQNSSRNTSRPLTPLESMEQSLEDDLLVDWQLDLEGIELVEWNNNLSRKLLQYSRQLKEDISKADGFRAGEGAEEGRTYDGGVEGEKEPDAGKVGHPQAWLSTLLHKLDNLHTETEKSRDLLFIAGDSIKEDDQVCKRDIAVTKTTQKIQETNSEERLVVEVKEIAQQTNLTTEAKETHSVSQQTNLVEETASECVGGRRGSGGLWGWFRYLVGFLLLLLVYTFTCGLEYEGRVYYPITYYPFRSLDFIPAPMVSIRFTRQPQYW